MSKQQVASWCVNWNGLDILFHGWILIDQGITLRSRAKFRMEPRKLTGFHQIPISISPMGTAIFCCLSKQIRFKVDTFDFPYVFFLGSSFFWWHTEDWYRLAILTCPFFFFGQNRPIFCRGPIGFSQVLGESFPEVIALQSNDEKLVKVAMQLKVFFFVRCGWVTGWSIYGEKGGSNVGVVFFVQAEVRIVALSGKYQVGALLKRCVRSQKEDELAAMWRWKFYPCRFRC